MRFWTLLRGDTFAGLGFGRRRLRWAALFLFIFWMFWVNAHLCRCLESSSTGDEVYLFTRYVSCKQLCTASPHCSGDGIQPPAHRSHRERQHSPPGVGSAVPGGSCLSSSISHWGYPFLELELCAAGWKSGGKWYDPALTGCPIPEMFKARLDRVWSNLGQWEVPMTGQVGLADLQKFFQLKPFHASNMGTRILEDFSPLVKLIPFSHHFVF